MESARYAINSDNDFYLSRLPILDLLLKPGYTLFVDKDFPGYHDMTLIQYAIAKRKPKTLELMLERMKKLVDDEKNILYPKTSNTKGNLIKLAIEFGSQHFYKTVDNSCLNVIIKCLNVDGFKNIESPLIQAIRFKNNDAITILMNNGADFMYPLQESGEINDESILSEMPIMVLFKLHNDEDELISLFDNALKDQKVNMIQRLLNLKINGKNFTSILNDLKLDQARLFIDNQRTNINEEINTIKNKSNGTQPESSQQPSNPQSPKSQKSPKSPKSNTQSMEQNDTSNLRKCFICSAHDGYNKCDKCDKFFCDNCYQNHLKTHDS